MAGYNMPTYIGEIITTLNRIERRMIDIDRRIADFNKREMEQK